MARTPKIKREVYESRQAVLEAPDDLGKPYRIKMPPLEFLRRIAGRTVFARGGSNSAVAFEVLRWLGCELRTLQATEMEEDEMIDMARDLPPEKRKQLLEELQKSFEVPQDGEEAQEDAKKQAKARTKKQQ